ncbi:MAG: hypothetical protein ABSB59_43050 [Streptosporangiaceae bacterium]|jgi:hypothetical protein
MIEAHGLVKRYGSTTAVTVDGRSYRDLPAPMREVGALLDAKALHGGRAIIGMSSSAAREAQGAVW